MSGRAVVVMPGDAAGRERVVSVVEELGFLAEVHDGAAAALGSIEEAPPSLVVHASDLPDMAGDAFRTALDEAAGDVPTLAVGPDADGGGPLADRLRALLDGETAETGAETAPSPPAGLAPVRAIGLGRWGVRVAEALAARGLVARAIDDPASLERTDLRHRHAIRFPRSDAPRHMAAFERALARDEGLARALAGDDGAALFLVAVDLGSTPGALVPALLERMEAVAPDVRRAVLARLPGEWSGTDERERALGVANAILDAPESGVLLVQSGYDTGALPADERAEIDRMVDVLELASGSVGEPLHETGMDGFAARLGTPGFHGLRVSTLSHWDLGGEEATWAERLAGAVEWQPQGFDWAGAQSLVAVVCAPEAALDRRAMATFERIVETAYDEAAPCALSRGLYAADVPPVAILVSAGMPFPAGVLDLRDSLYVDRARLAEKRRAALRPMRPLLPSGERGRRPARARPPLRLLPGPVRARRVETVEVEVEEVAEATAPAEPEPATGPEAAAAPRADAAPHAASPWGDDDAEATATEEENGAEEEAEAAANGGPAVAGAGEEAAGPRAPVSPPEAYTAALDLAEDVLRGRVPIAEIDLDDVRCAVYDLLELLREDPDGLLGEVLRPEPEGWFERHHVNTTALALLTGDRLGRPFGDLVETGIAAFLHDVGMVPTREVWDRPNRLEPTAFQNVVRPHPEVGHRRIREIAGMTRSIARIVLHEHERMDGSGYPEGLQGEAIESGARIVAACDTLEALTHPRPHRPVPPERPLESLREMGRYLLDASVVEALVEALEERAPMRPAAVVEGGRAGHA